MKLISKTKDTDIYKWLPWVEVKQLYCQGAIG